MILSWYYLYIYPFYYQCMILFRSKSCTVNLEWQICGNARQITMKFGIKGLYEKLLLQSQLAVADVLLSQDHLNLMRMFNFLDIYFRKIALLILLVTLVCANKFVKIYNLIPFIQELSTNQWYFTLKVPIQFTFLTKTILY